MLQEITYDEWKVRFNDLWEFYTNETLEDEDLEEIDYFLDDGTILFRHYWDGEAWQLEDTTIYPVYEDTASGAMGVVGFSEF